MIAILFGLAALLSLLVMLAVYIVPDSRMNKHVAKMVQRVTPEAIAAICLVCFISFTMIAAVSLSDRCDNCDRVVGTAYCTYCGTKNNSYIEHAVENNTGLICPICDVECHTPFCGDCGSEIVFVEVVDAVSGG